MRGIPYLSLMLCFICPWVVCADFVNLASLEITEIRATEFEVVLTLPVYKGTVLKVQPIFPETFRVLGEPTERAVNGSVLRTWSMTCNTPDLVGAIIGVEGLLGTSQEILLTIKTLSGRCYRHTFRATDFFYAIPKPPTGLSLARQASLHGLQEVLRRFDLVLLIYVIFLLDLRWHTMLLVFLTFASAQMLGRGLAIQNWMVVSPFWTRTFCPLITLLIVSGLLNRDRKPTCIYKRFLWIPMFLLGLLYGGSNSEIVTEWVLSTKEQYLALLFGAVGILIACGLLTACLREAKIVPCTWQEVWQHRWRFGILYTVGVLAAALFWYEASTPLFVQGIVPALPVIYWVMISCLGLWGRETLDQWSSLLIGTIGVCFGLGFFLSFAYVSIPMLNLVLLIFLVYLGVGLLFSPRGPKWLQILLVAGGLFYFGHAAGYHFQDSAALPMAHGIGAIVLLCFLFFVCYQIIPGDVVVQGAAASTNRRPFPIRAYGLMVCVFSVLWRLQEYGDWFKAEVFPELAMGSMPVPVLTALLMLWAGLAWPRRRRFQVESAATPAVLHWFLMGSAFFFLPHGVLRFRRPFYTPHAPTPVKARHIMERLLTDTYLAFNVTDGDRAFDALEANLSENLIADVYLDSRRRLNAGTRQGTQVTVRVVQVNSVDPVLTGSQSQSSFTYPCQWSVTSRVKHFQHIHDRHNIYLGELTIGIEDNRWKITKLVLKNEERVIKQVWQKA